MRGLLVLVLAVTVSGCGYALAGKGNSLPPEIRRIGVPDFKNLSNVPELDRLVTEAVRLEFQSRGKYVIVPDAANVDAVLTGSIRMDAPLPTTFTAQASQASKYLVTLVAAAEFKLTKDGKIFYANTSFRTSDEYDVASGTSNADIATLFTQDRNAMERLARTFARSLVQAILETF